MTTVGHTVILTKFYFRLVIVHPSELNGAKVEVVAKPLLTSQTESSNRISNDYENINIKSLKPAPPPRHIEDSQKPPVTPPPKSADVLNIQKQVKQVIFHLFKSHETEFYLELVIATCADTSNAPFSRFPEPTLWSKKKKPCTRT